MSKATPQGPCPLGSGSRRRDPGTPERSQTYPGPRPWSDGPQQNAWLVGRATLQPAGPGDNDPALCPARPVSPMSSTH